MKQVFQQVTNLDRLKEQLKPDSVRPTSDGVEFDWTEQLAADLKIQIPRIQAAQVIAQAIVGPRMGKLQSIAERIKQTKSSLEAEADKLAAQLDEIDKVAPSAFANGTAYIGQLKTDVHTMDSELRQLSNLPLDSSSTASST